MSEINLHNDLPSTYTLLDYQEVQTKMMDEVYQPEFDKLEGGVARFADIGDVDNCDVNYLLYHAFELGWRLDPTLSAAIKRKTVRLLTSIYKQKGSKLGIINAIRLFLSLEVTIFADNVDGWILGASELGEGTVLAVLEDNTNIYDFYVNFPRDLTATERGIATTIINFMKYHHERAFLVEPETTTPLWSLGESQLGVDSILSA